MSNKKTQVEEMRKAPPMRLHAVEQQQHVAAMVTNPLLAPVVGPLVTQTVLQLIEQGQLASRDQIRRVAGNPEEWGAAWGMSGAKVRDLIRRGLPHVRIGAQTRIQFDSAEVLEWLRANGDYLAEGGEP